MGEELIPEWRLTHSVFLFSTLLWSGLWPDQGCPWRGAGCYDRSQGDRNAVTQNGSESLFLVGFPVKENHNKVGKKNF